MGNESEKVAWQALGEEFVLRQDTWEPVKAAEQKRDMVGATVQGALREGDRWEVRSESRMLRTGAANNVWS